MSARPSWLSNRYTTLEGWKKEFYWIPKPGTTVEEYEQHYAEFCKYLTRTAAELGKFPPVIEFRDKIERQPGFLNTAAGEAMRVRVMQEFEEHLKRLGLYDERYDPAATDRKFRAAKEAHERRKAAPAVRTHVVCVYPEVQGEAHDHHRE